MKNTSTRWAKSFCKIARESMYVWCYLLEGFGAREGCKHDLFSRLWKTGHPGSTQSRTDSLGAHLRVYVDIGVNRIFLSKSCAQGLNKLC